MNFSKGILESRKQHYKHLAKLLRPIPLNTPTVIELTPRLRIRVTLLDANHCLGAVMFLIEGDGKAVLYTGDIRAETWWVNGLVRHPVLIPYTLGSKRLDKIYLDTTFAIKSDVYRSFPSKAEGLRELLEKVHAYPEDTIFYLRAWTFGYEDVWLALATALDSKIHVDRYQRGLYQSLETQDRKIPEAAFLCGFDLGNNSTPGCLTDDESCRIHSCEPGMFCPVIASGKAVHITPIVTRSDDTEVPEIGIGGGGGDLYQSHELELPDKTSVEQLKKLCLEHIPDVDTFTRTKEALLEAFRSKKKTLSLDKYGLKDENDISLRKLVDVLSHGQSFDTNDTQNEQRLKPDGYRGSEHELPKQITFPYSRHSSYAELCELVAAFRPKDIFPCTVDPDNWSEDVSMARLFGHLFSADTFSHDEYMYKLLSEQQEKHKQVQHASFSTQLSRHSEHSSQMSQAALYQSAVGPVGYDGVLETYNQLPKTSASDSPYLRNDPPSSLSTSSMVSPFQKDTNAASDHHPSMNRKYLLPDHETANSPQQGHQEQPPNAPHPIPERTESARKSRNKLRKAWYEMENLRKQGKWHVHNEPLPTWWPTEEEDHYHDESSDDGSDVAGRNNMAHPAPENHSTTDMDVASIDVDMNADADADSDPDTHLPESQTSNNPSLSLSISLSESAFDSQDQPLPSTATSDPQPNTDNTNNNDTDDRPSGPTKRKRSPDSSIRNRIRAYHAARSGSWSEVSLLSAGNNHTEEEVEL
ncbi:hypothetical protein Plec18170_004681 [Paecilomyces lecythidis]